MRRQSRMEPIEKGRLYFAEAMRSRKALEEGDMGDRRGERVRERSAGKVSRFHS